MNLMANIQGSLGKRSKELILMAWFPPNKLKLKQVHLVYQIQKDIKLGRERSKEIAPNAWFPHNKVKLQQVHLLYQI